MGITLRVSGLSLRKQIRGVTKALHKDDGNVESAMVLIPLLILFLVGIEIIAATNLRNGDVALAQGEASRRAISGEIYSSDEIIELNSPDRFSHITTYYSSPYHSAATSTWLSCTIRRSFFH